VSLLFIGEVLRVLKNTFEKGLSFELRYSKDFHKIGVPLLISSNLLRRNNAGQVDISRLRSFKGEWIVELRELKTNEFNTQRSQYQRLLKAVRLLSEILELRFEFSYVFDKE
jgi:hypothetical protein